MTRWILRCTTAGSMLLVLASGLHADDTKLNPTARLALDRLRSGVALQRAQQPGTEPGIESAAAAPGGELDVLISGTVTRSELEAAGASVRSEIPGGIFTASIPADRVDAVTALAGVRFIEAAVLCDPSLDASVPTTGASNLRGAGPAFTGLNGAGIVVGDVDTGVDFDHGDFKDPGGLTRFLNIWDQTGGPGPPPGGFAIGTEWSAAQINGGLCTETDPVSGSNSIGHGTHVIGIAGGDGSQTGGAIPAFTYVGMAPKADLIMVKTTSTSSAVMDGVNYVFQRATALGRPAVCNLSLGSHFGPHDGTSLFESGLSALTGTGKILCVAAGNEAGTAIHGDAFAAGAGTDMTISTNAGTTLNREWALDGYYNATENLSIQITTPNGTVIGPVPLGGNSGNVPTANGQVYFENGFTPTPGGSREVFIDVWNNPSLTGQNQSGTWTIRLIPVTLGAANGEVDFWRFFQSSTAFASNFVTGNDPTKELMREPANAVDAIACAAYVTKNFWTYCNGSSFFYSPLPTIGTIAPFSSPGPTRDGRQKPDIAAPGQGIVSATSFDGGNSTCPGVFSFPSLINDNRQHFLSQGTSMAAPHVTGAAALLQQKFGPMTVAQVKSILSARATVDGQTGAVWNNSFGNGKLFLGDLTDPLCAVIFPNGGEVLVIGDVRTLTWNASDAYQGVTGVDLEISRDNGATWSPIASNVSNTGSYNWTVSGPVTSQALLRVTAKDAANNQGIDRSDQTWMVDDAVATTLTLFRAEATPEGVRIEWRFEDPSQFASLSLERAPGAVGPWTALDVELTQDGASTVAIDRTAESGRSYYYRIAATYRTGESATFGPLVATAGEPITEFAFERIAPNPTAGTTAIDYTVPRASEVEVAIFDLQGREVASLAKGNHPVGRYHVTWDGRGRGAEAPAGIYFLRLKAPGISQARRVVVSR